MDLQRRTTIRELHIISESYAESLNRQTIRRGGNLWYLINKVVLFLSVESGFPPTHYNCLAEFNRTMHVRTGAISLEREARTVRTQFSGNEETSEA